MTPGTPHRLFLQVMLFAAAPISNYSWSEPSPGFDCEQASNFVENAICDDSLLASLDVYLNTVYRQYVNLSFSPERLKSQQIDWLKERDACQTESCVKQSYFSRINAIIEGASNIDGGFTALDPAVAIRHFHQKMEVVKKDPAGAVGPGSSENPYLPKMPMPVSDAWIESFERKGTQEYLFRYAYRLGGANAIEGSFVVNASGDLVRVEQHRLMTQEVASVPRVDAQSQQVKPQRPPARPRSMPQPRSPGQGGPSFGGRAGEDPVDRETARALFSGYSEDLRLVHDLLLEAEASGLEIAGRALQFFSVKPAKMVSGAGVLPCERHDGQLYRMDGGDTYDRVECSWGHEIIDTYGAGDHIEGGWGNEMIAAGPGTDTIDGSWGDEVIYPGAGDDDITGSWGSLVLVYGREWGTDTVKDECSLIIFSSDVEPSDLVWKDNNKLYNKKNGGSIQFDSACSETYYSDQSF